MSVPCESWRNITDSTPDQITEAQVRDYWLFLKNERKFSPISDLRISFCDDGRVTFSYRKSGDKRWRKMTVDAMEFIRRFLQHVLPRGLQKVRHYGFLAANSSLTVEAARWLVTLYNGGVFAVLALTAITPTPRPVPRCTECNGPLRIVAVIPRRAPQVFDSS